METKAGPGTHSSRHAQDLICLEYTPNDVALLRPNQPRADTAHSLILTWSLLYAHAWLGSDSRLEMHT